VHGANAHHKLSAGCGAPTPKLRFEMKKREHGDASGDRKSKGLQQRWFTLGKKNVQTSTTNTNKEDRFIENNDVVTLLDKMKSLQHNKHRNQWFCQ